MELKEATQKILEEQVALNNCVGNDQYSSYVELASGSYTRVSSAYSEDKLYIDKVLDNGSTLLMSNGRKYSLGEVQGVQESGEINNSRCFELKYWPIDEQRGDWDIIILSKFYDDDFEWIHGS